MFAPLIPVKADIHKLTDLHGRRNGLPQDCGLKRDMGELRGVSFLGKLGQDMLQRGPVRADKPRLRVGHSVNGGTAVSFLAG